MSVSTYTSQVNRLGSDLATLRGQAADARKKLADANGKVLNAAQALQRVTSTSQFSSKARDVERYQKAAADLEKKAADVDKRIADKQKALTSAQSNLERAQKDEQRKQDRDAEKRRKADLDHIRTMESARRQSSVLPQSIRARPSVPARPFAPGFTETFDVCLSFAGEQRDYVERIAQELKAAGLRVFYDQDEDIAALVWGRDLGELLDYVYRQGSRFCVMFISSDYADKAWTTHERRSALARAVEEEGYVLPARFDDTELPGLRPTVAYLDLRETAPATLVEFITKRLRSTS